jgi:hypothetical protein
MGKRKERSKKRYKRDTETENGDKVKGTQECQYDKQIRSAGK